ncbi:MAG: ABC transporter permease [Limisphaerales bacterium]
MNFKRIRTLAYKEWRELVRDRLFFSLSILVPAILMLIFGFGLSLDVENIPLAIVDYDHSALSREYAHKFIDSRYFNFKGYSRDERTIDRMLTRAEIRAALVIPKDFERSLLAGQPATVQTLLDGTFPFRSTTTKGYVRAINSAISSEVLARYLSQAGGIPSEQALRMVQPVRLEVRYLYNQSVESIWSLAPKLIMVILIIAPPFMTALGVVREKESGSIYNIYASTVSRGEFLVGKLAPYVGVSIFNAVVLWVMAITIFGAPFKGNPLFFFCASALYVVCTTGIGVVVSTFARTQIAAMIATAVLTVVPAVLYSGVLIPVSSLSPTTKVVAHLLPAMYFTNIVLGAFLKGVGLNVLWGNVLVLALYATGLFTIGYLLFRKRPAV